MTDEKLSPEQLAAQYREDNRKTQESLKKLQDAMEKKEREHRETQEMVMRLYESMKKQGDELKEKDKLLKKLNSKFEENDEKYKKYEEKEVIEEKFTEILGLCLDINKKNVALWKFLGLHFLDVVEGSTSTNPDVGPLVSYNLLDRISLVQVGNYFILKMLYAAKEIQLDSLQKYFDLGTWNCWKDELPGYNYIDLTDQLMHYKMSDTSEATHYLEKGWKPCLEKTHAYLKDIVATLKKDLQLEKDVKEILKISEESRTVIYESKYNIDTSFILNCKRENIDDIKNMSKFIASFLTLKEEKKEEKELEDTLASDWVDYLKLWVGANWQAGSKLVRIFSTKIDGDKSATFHTKCNGKENTITIAKSEHGFLFGGYTKTAWNSSAQYSPRQPGVSFVFRLDDTTLANKPVKLNNSGSHSTYSIYGNVAYGPTFGGGHDIYLTSDCTKNTNSSSNLGHSYETPKGHRYGEDKTKNFLAGYWKFKVLEYEVFQIQPL